MRDHTVLRRPMLMGRTPTPRQGVPYIQGGRTFAQVGDPLFDLMDVSGPLQWHLRVVAGDPGNLAVDVTVTFASNLITDIIDDINASGLNTVLTARMAGRSVALEHRDADMRSYIWIRKPVLGGPLDRDAAYALGFPVEDDPFSYVAGGDVRFTFGEIDDSGQRRLTGPGTAAHDFGTDWTAVSFNRQVDLLSRELDRHDARGRRHVGNEALIEVDTTGGYPHALVAVGGADPAWYQGSRPAGWYYALEVDPAQFPYLWEKPNYAADPIDEWAQLLRERYAVMDVWGNEILSYSGSPCSVIAVTRGQPNVGVLADFAAATWLDDTDGAAPGHRWQDDAGTNLLQAATIKEIDGVGTTAATIGDIYYSTAIRVVDGLGDPIDLTGYVQPGDTATITGHAVTAQPFNHNGDYVVESVGKDPMLDVSSMVFLRPTAPTTGAPEDSRGVLNPYNAGGYGNVSFFASGLFADTVWLMIDPPIPPWYDNVVIRLGVLGEAGYPNTDGALTDIPAEGSTVLEQLHMLNLKGPMVSTTFDWLAAPYTTGEPDPGAPPFTYTPPTGYPGDPLLSMEDIGRRIDLQGAYEGMARGSGSGGQIVVDHDPIETFSYKTFGDPGGGLPWRQFGAQVVIPNVTVTRFPNYVRLQDPADTFRFTDIGNAIRFVNGGFGVLHTLKIIDYNGPGDVNCDLDEFALLLLPEGASGVVTVYMYSSVGLYPQGIGNHAMGQGLGQAPRASTVSASFILGDPATAVGDTHDHLIQVGWGAVLNPDGTLEIADLDAIEYLAGYFVGGSSMDAHFRRPGYSGDFPCPLHIEIINEDPTEDGAGRYAVESVVSLVTTPGLELLTLQLCEIGMPGQVNGPSAPVPVGIFPLAAQGYHNSIIDYPNLEVAAHYSRGEYLYDYAHVHGYVADTMGVGATGFFGRAYVPAGNVPPADSPDEDARVMQPFWGLSWAPAYGAGIFEHYGVEWALGLPIAPSAGFAGQALISRLYQVGQLDGVASWNSSVHWDPTDPTLQFGGPGIPYGSLASGAWGEWRDVTDGSWVAADPDDLSTDLLIQTLALFGLSEEAPSVGTYIRWAPRTWDTVARFFGGQSHFFDSDVFVEPVEWDRYELVPSFGERRLYEPTGYNGVNSALTDCGFVFMGTREAYANWALRPTFINYLIPPGNDRYDGIIVDDIFGGNAVGLMPRTANIPPKTVGADDNKVVQVWEFGGGGISPSSVQDIGIVSGPAFGQWMVGGYFLVLPVGGGHSEPDLFDFNPVPASNQVALGAANYEVIKVVRISENGGSNIIHFDRAPFGATDPHRMRYIGHLWDDVVGLRAQFEQSLRVYGNIHPQQLEDAGLSQDPLAHRGGMYSHYLFISDDAEDGMLETAGRSSTNYDGGAFAKIPRFMYCSPQFYAAGPTTGAVDYMAAAWGQVSFMGTRPGDYAAGVTQTEWDYSRQMLRFNDQGPVRVDDRMYWPLATGSESPHSLGPMIARRGTSWNGVDHTLLGDESDWYVDMDQSQQDFAQWLGLGENSHYLDTLAMSPATQIGGLEIDNVVNLGGNNQLTADVISTNPVFLPADLGRPLDIFVAPDNGTNPSDLVFRGYIYEYVDSQNVKISSFMAHPSSPVETTGYFGVLRGSQWTRVSAEYIHGTRFSFGGVPMNEPGIIKRDKYDATPSGAVPLDKKYMVVEDKGTYKRWTHRWTAAGWTWMTGNYNAVSGAAEDTRALGPDPESFYSVGSAISVAPQNFKYSGGSLIIQPGAALFKVLSSNRVDDPTDGLKQCLELETQIHPTSIPTFTHFGGYVMHELSLPHEWKSRDLDPSSDEDYHAPWVRKIGFTFAIPPDTYGVRKYWPWVVLARVSVDLPSAGDPGLEIIAGALFEEITGVMAGGVYSCDTSGDGTIDVQERTPVPTGIFETFGFPANCPIRNSAFEDGQSYRYMILAGLAPQWVGGEEGSYLSLEGDAGDHPFSLHTGWAEYSIPEILAGF